MRALWLLPLALVACSDGGRGASPSPQAFPSSTSVSASAAATVAVTNESGDVHFRTPSGNIGCYVTVANGSADCEVTEHTWALPSRPPGCEFDWGAIAALRRTGPATMGACVSDTLIGAPRVLAYGTGVRAGGIQCVSETTGVTCTNLTSKRGFFVSRERYRLF